VNVYTCNAHRQRYLTRHSFIIQVRFVLNHSMWKYVWFYAGEKFAIILPETVQCSLRCRKRKYVDSSNHLLLCSNINCVCVCTCACVMCIHPLYISESCLNTLSRALAGVRCPLILFTVHLYSWIFTSFQMRPFILFGIVLLILTLVLEYIQVECKPAKTKTKKYLYEEVPIYLNPKKPYKRRKKFAYRIPKLMRGLTDGSFVPSRYFYIEPYYY
jgi:hypothetical protein